MASIVSPNPCSERALVGKLMRRQRMKFGSQYGRIIARYPKHYQRSGIAKHRRTNKDGHLLDKLCGQCEVSGKLTRL